MLWLWAAIGTAALWGFSYALVERLLKGGISSFALLALYTWLALPAFTFLAWQDKSLGSAVEQLKANPKMLGSLVLVVICYFIGNALIYWGIQQKNATAVSLIEITYPFFVALFSFLLFQQNNLTIGTLIGGVLIFIGVFVMALWK